MLAGAGLGTTVPRPLHLGGPRRMSDGTTIALLAHAKVNLYLAVGARRPDGYHQVTTVVQAIGLADEVRVSVDSDSDGLHCEGAEILADENLAWRAVLAFRDSHSIGAPARIEIAKRIPCGAGLGGGSADAAAVLWALEQDLEPQSQTPSPRLLADAASIGTDVPFFLGPGTQLLGGRGDEMLEVLPTPDLHVVVVNPGVGVATGSAYAQFDRMLAPSPPPPDVLLRAIREGNAEAIAANLLNNLTEASVGLVPETREALRFLEGHDGVLGCAMAGSGSSVFGICADRESALGAAGDAEGRGWWAQATWSVPAGIGRTHSAS